MTALITFPHAVTARGLTNPSISHLWRTAQVVSVAAQNGDPLGNNSTRITNLNYTLIKHQNQNVYLTMKVTLLTAVCPKRNAHFAAENYFWSRWCVKQGKGFFLCHLRVKDAVVTRDLVFLVFHNLTHATCYEVLDKVLYATRVLLLLL